MRLSTRTKYRSAASGSTPRSIGRKGLFAAVRREDGQSLVEFALCVPILLLIVTGTFTFGIAMNNFIMLTDATNVGARLLAISRGQYTDPCSKVAAAVAAAAPNLSSSALAYTFVLNGTSYPGGSCNSPTTTTGPAANLVQGGIVKVTVTYPCNLRVYGTNYAPNCLLTAQTTELVQ